MRQRVVVTGLGAISSFGVGAAALTDALLRGDCGVAAVTDFDTSHCRAHRAAQVRGFDPVAFLSPMKLRKIDAVGRLAVVATRLVFDDAGAVLPPGGRGDVGVAFGTSTAGLDSTVDYLRSLTREGPGGAPALLFSNTVANAAASLCAIEYGLRGPNVTFSHREVSSLAAIAYAVVAVDDGRVGAMLTGGADHIEEIYFNVLDRFHALSPKRRGGDECARPFDRRRNGMVLGDGAYMLLVESVAAAEARGCRPYGEILGIGMTSSPTAMNEWPGEPEGMVRAMQLALAEAELAPRDIAAVFAAADGSPVLDAVEALAIGRVFGDREVPVTSIHGAIGESGVSGAAAIIAGLHLVPQGKLPPTVGFAEADSQCAVRVSGAPQAVQGDTFLVNGTASGGTNIAVVVRAFAGTAK